MEPACKTPKPGDYVLATKWNDGSMQDQWCVGFYSKAFKDRHIVTDTDGTPYRQSGFRRVEIITVEQGAELLSNSVEIASAYTSIWNWLRQSEEVDE